MDIFEVLLVNSFVLLGISSINLAFYIKTDTKNKKTQFLQGIFFSGTLLVLMNLSWGNSTGVFYDSRTILIAIISSFYSLFTTLIVLTIGSLFRIFLGGDGAIAGIITIICTGILGITFKHYIKPMIKGPSLIYYYLFGIVVHLFMLLYHFALPMEIDFILNRIKLISPTILIVFPVITVFLSEIIKIGDDRIHQKNKLVESEEQYRLLTSEMQLGLALHETIYDDNGKPVDYKFINVNKSFERLMGLKSEDLVGKTVLEVLPNIEKYWIDAYADVALTGKSFKYNNYSKELNKYFSTSTYSPKKGQFASIVEDVTERALSENQREKDHRDLVKSQKIAKLGTWRLDVKNNEVTWSEELYKMYRFDPTQPVPPYTEHMKLFTKQSWDKLSKALALTSTKGIPYELELEMAIEDEPKGWMWVRGEAEYDDQGQIVSLTGAAQDITKRKQLEHNLKEAHQIAKLGRWELIHKEQRLVWSETIFNIFEIDSKRFESSYEGFLKVIHPDDRSTVDKAFNTSLVNKQAYYIEHRLLMDDGRIKWVSEKCNTEFDEKGQPIRSIGVVQDITERKLADIEVTYRKELLQYIIGHSNQGIAVHDKDLIYVYVSDEYCNMYHVDKDIIGKHHYEVFPDLPQKWRDVHQRTLKGETLKEDRDIFKRADGSIQHTRWLSQPWYDAHGEIAGIIIYTEVINDLIDTEVQLQNTVDQLGNTILDLVKSQKIAKLGTWRLDVNTNEVTMSEELYKIYGFDPTQPNPPVIEHMKLFTKPSWNKLSKALALTSTKGIPYEMELERAIGDKSSGWMWVKGEAEYDNQGNIVSVIGLAQDITDKKQRELEIIHTSNHDFLTGLPNRKYFEERLIELDQKQYYPLLIAMIDFDGLKLINDAYGRDIGDESLKKVSKVLIDNLRENDFLARIGGDEFIILCPNTTSNDFDKIENSILNSINSISVEDVKVSLSIGYDMKYDTSMDISEVLKNAENDMYSNKILHGQSARNETIMTLFETLNEKYEEEKIHSNRVSQFCKQMGEKLDLTKDQIKELEFAGLMHDIGKITIPDSILDKPGKLTDDEWVIMKKHTINGYNILRSADKYSRLAEYALTHHEHWDGKGYPNGLKGEDIPLFSRIISISDAYEAMTADRPYRKALDKKIAIEELYRCAGFQFDAKLVEIFVKEVIRE